MRRRVCAGAQFEAALMGMYDFAAGDKLLNDKLTVLAVSLGPSPLAPSLAPIVPGQAGSAMQANLCVARLRPAHSAAPWCSCPAGLRAGCRGADSDDGEQL